MNFCKALVGEKYTCKIEDIKRLDNKFNVFLKSSILCNVEEVVCNAGDYHSVQSKLKSLITENTMMIEPKGVDSYMIDVSCNFIISTNENNPVKITEDNRRFCVLDFSNARRNDSEFFGNLETVIREL